MKPKLKKGKKERKKRKDNSATQDSVLRNVESTLLVKYLSSTVN